MDIKVFTRNNKNKTFNLSDDNIIGSGTVGVVYRNMDRCFKLLTRHNRWQIDIIIKILEELKKIDSANLCKIHDIYYENYLDTKSIVGYEMDYYSEDKLNILYSSMDYILDNFSDLIKLISEITKKGISIEDLHSGNVILQNDRIIVIDVDNYQIDKSPYQELFYRNCKQLKLLLRGMLLESLRCSGLEENLYWEYLESFKLLKYNNHQDIQFILQELKKYKTPYEFIKKYK